jgi:hypothetical protein
VCVPHCICYWTLLDPLDPLRSGSAVSRFNLLIHRVLSHNDAGSARALQQICLPEPIFLFPPPFPSTLHGMHTCAWRALLYVC